MNSLLAGLGIGGLAAYLSGDYFPTPKRQFKRKERTMDFAPSIEKALKREIGNVHECMQTDWIYDGGKEANASNLLDFVNCAAYGAASLEEALTEQTKKQKMDPELQYVRRSDLMLEYSRQLGNVIKEWNLDKRVRMR